MSVWSKSLKISFIAAVLVSSTAVLVLLSGVFADSLPLIYATAAIALTAAALCAAWFFKSLDKAERRLKQALLAVESLSEGDFESVQTPTHTPDVIGEIEYSVQSVADYLRETALITQAAGRAEITETFEPRSERDRLGKALKITLDQVQSLNQSKLEREHLQQAIMKLLNEVADVANGDLTVSADVTEEATGALADAFNFMVGELRSVIERVQQTSALVSHSTNIISRTTNRLADGSYQQAQQISMTSAAIEEMATSIQEVSTNAELSSQVAAESIINARKGVEVVQNNINAMNRIRGQVQETAKRIKRLGERSQEIGEIVKIIDDLADRTSVLALNASLQAAMAGEAGRGFVFVAEEVERLAEHSSDATKQIELLTRSIQNETKDVVNSMEETIREVVTGSHLANQTGNALQEIEMVSGKLASLIQSISDASQQQAEGSDELAKSMIDISKITELVAYESQQVAESVSDLVALTGDMNSSVSAFRLPATRKTAPLNTTELQKLTVQMAADSFAEADKNANDKMFRFDEPETSENSLAQFAYSR